MSETKADIINRLQKEILSLQDFKSAILPSSIDHALGQIKNAFPNKIFPLGAIHEFIYNNPNEAAATTGFVSVIMAAMMQSNGIAVWICAKRTIFPPALKQFGIEPDKIIFIELKKEIQMLWALEEALKCEGLCAVIGEINALSFNHSRRLQLAVEQSKVTGFILRNQIQHLNTTACVARWRISSLKSDIKNNFPGVGFPKWNIELLKVRNGKPGIWQVECIAGRLHDLIKSVPDFNELQLKTG
ncbi:MAG: Error-prone repair protein ImuA [Bacteroidetes bacterium]|nr:Error-prone repair protein ImuA [Bacteroidota bacterium]